MKRFFALILTVVLIGMSSVASADLLFQTSGYDFILPDSWFYDTPGILYAKCQTGKSAVFNLYESNNALPDSTEEIAERSVDTFKARDYMTGFEEIEILGHKTALVSLVTGKGLKGYIAIVPFGNKTVETLYLTTSEPDKEFYKNVLSSVRQRPEADRGFFTYGDVEVKFKNFTTKTSGGKKYLILNFDWRNVGTSPTMFVVNVGVTAFQDGIELHEGYLFSEQTEVGTKIMPGKELPVKVIFELRNSTGEVTFTVDKLMDFNNEAVGREYTLNIK